MMEAHEIANETARKIGWGVSLVGFGFATLIQLLNSTMGGWMIFLVSLAVGVTAWGLAYTVAFLWLRPKTAPHVVFSNPVVHKAPAPSSALPEPFQPAWMTNLANKIVGDMIYIDEGRLEKLEDVTVPELHKVAQARYAGRLPEVSERSLDNVGVPRSSGRAKAVKDWLQGYGYVSENGQRQALTWTQRADRLFIPPPPLVRENA